MNTSMFANTNALTDQYEIFGQFNQREPFSNTALDDTRSGKMLVRFNNRLTNEIETLAVLEKIGEGSSCAVFLGKSLLRAQTYYAIKILRKECLHSVQAERFERESELLCRLRHPNIALGIGTGAVNQNDTADNSEPLPFIVMELLQKTAFLQATCSSPQAIANEALKVVRGIANALTYLQIDGRIMAHRDIKPANIMLGADNTPKLIDLGIAKMAMIAKNSLDTALTGTVKYMSPEQLIDASCVDIRSDIYSLGLVLLNMLGWKRQHISITTVRNTTHQNALHKNTNHQSGSASTNNYIEQNSLDETVTSCKVSYEYKGTHIKESSKQKSPEAQHNQPLQQQQRQKQIDERKELAKRMIGEPIMLDRSDQHRLGLTNTQFEKLNTIISKMCAYEPSLRYQLASLLVKDIDELLFELAPCEAVDQVLNQIPVQPQTQAQPLVSDQIQSQAHLYQVQPQTINAAQAQTFVQSQLQSKNDDHTASVCIQNQAQLATHVSANTQAQESIQTQTSAQQAPVKQQPQQQCTQNAPPKKSGKISKTFAICCFAAAAACVCIAIFQGSSGLMF